MCTFTYMYLSACVYSNILKLLYIYIFKSLTFENHDLSSPGPNPGDVPVIMQLVAELLSWKEWSPYWKQSSEVEISSIANLETFPMIV